MQREFTLVLAGERHQARVVWARADFREPDIVALHEKLDAENSLAAESGGHFSGDVARCFERARAHGLRLPALDVIAVDLDVAYRFAEMRAVGGADGEQRDLEIEVDLSFDNHARLLHAAGGER